jgi:hypothetical protein
MPQKSILVAYGPWPALPSEGLDPSFIGMSSEVAPASTSVREGRDAYLDENGFTVAAYDEPRTEVTFLGLDFAVPNTAAHRRAIMLHDLHHVATGYGTDLAGEGEISAWELRAGQRGLDLYVRAIIATGALLGLIVAPRRMLRAWRAARGARALWTQSAMGDDGTARRDYDGLLALDVGQLREKTGVPAAGVAAGPRGLHARASRVRLAS